MQPHEIQRSPEWYEFRKSGIGASEAACCLGIDPWKNQYDLWLEKIGMKEGFKGNEHTERGLRLEEPARLWAEKELGMPFKPIVRPHPSISYMYASLDGYNEENNVILEIKAPEKVLHDEIPAYNFPQLMHQNEVFRPKYHFYMSYMEINNVPDWLILEVKRDDDYIEKLIEAERIFWDCVINCIEPECPKQYTQRNDSAYHERLRIYLNNKKHLELWKDLTDKSRDELLAITEGNTQSLGYKISERVKPGVVDYKQIVKDYNIDIKPYRKEPSRYFDIREYK